MAQLKSISDMAGLYGVSLRTLRFYEDRGLLQPIRHGTARYYSPENRIRLELILKGKRLGFSLSEITRLIDDRNRPNPSADDIGLSREQIAAQIDKLQQKRDETDQAIADLKRTLSIPGD